jgi:hypothetical protein
MGAPTRDPSSRTPSPFRVRAPGLPSSSVCIRLPAPAGLTVLPSVEAAIGVAVSDPQTLGRQKRLTLRGVDPGLQHLVGCIQPGMARVFVTGSSDGLGLVAARRLIGQGHEVVLHGQNEGRSRDALAAAAGVGEVVSGDLYHRWGENSCRRGQQARRLRRRDPQCGHRLSRGTGGDGARGSERLRR